MFNFRARDAAMLALLLVAANFGIAATPNATLAANPADPDGNVYTENLAGRPLNGYSYDVTPSCESNPSACLSSASGGTRQWWPSVSNYIYGVGTGHGITYANVGGLVALLYPYHGRTDSSYDGKKVYGPNDSAIGYWQTQSSLTYNGNTAQQHDLAVIILYQGNWPASLNQVYRGNVTGNDFWTITENTSIATSCTQDGSNNSDTLLSLIGDGRTVYQNGPQFSYLSSEPFRTGALDGVSWNVGGCVVRVTLTDASDAYRDSGTSFVLCCNAQNYVHTVWAFASLRDTSVGPPYPLVVTPLYEGLHVLYQKYQALGSTAGLCKTATCGGLT